MREIVVTLDYERKLFLYFGVILIAIGVGPFGTYEVMTFWQRATFWTLDVLGGMAIIAPIHFVFFNARLAAGIPLWPRFFGGVAIGALPAAGFIAVLYKMVSNGVEIPASFPILYIEVAIFSAVLLLSEFVFWPLLFGPPAPGEPPADAAADVAEPVPLLEKLPAVHRGADVVSISMQDHYAHVFTTAGDDLVLLRLGDAIALLGLTPGAQVHRSHWAAARFAARLERSGRRHDLVLADGRRIPVSASYLDAARALVG